MRLGAGTTGPREKQKRSGRLTSRGAPHSLRRFPEEECMRQSSTASFGLILVVGVTLVTGCGGGSNEQRGADKHAAAPSAAAGVPDAVVATVAGRTITHAELEAHVRPRLIEIDAERYDALREGLDELIADELMTAEA